MTVSNCGIRESKPGILSKLGGTTLPTGLDGGVGTIASAVPVITLTISLMSSMEMARGVTEEVEVMEILSEASTAAFAPIVALVS